MKVLTEARLRRYIRQILSESIDPRIQKRLSTLIDDPAYSDVRVMIEKNPGKTPAFMVEYVRQSDLDAKTPRWARSKADPTGRLAIAKLGSDKSFKRGNCLGAWHVMESRATKGWGPLLYDIALEIVGSSGIVPDRLTVSDEARRVWNEYESRSDVDKIQLDILSDKDLRSYLYGLEYDQLTPDDDADDCEQLSAAEDPNIPDPPEDNWMRSALSKKYVKRNTSVIDTLRAHGKLIER